MKIVADTNLLLRAVEATTPDQTASARQIMSEAEVVVLPIACLCEYVWTLRSRYKIGHAEIASSLRALVAGRNVIFDQDALETGLRFLDAGGDFADGAIVASGLKMGGEIFVTFDKRAARIAQSLGIVVRKP